tara:strand:- start:556 stop:849 length:294 start_codon:yes stop_codon:yes gene_type:complete
MKTSKIKFIVRHNNNEYRIWFVKFNPNTCWMEGGYGPKDWGWSKHLNWAWHKQSEEIEKERLIAYVQAKYNEVLVIDEPSYNRHWTYKPYNKKLIKK